MVNSYNGWLASKNPADFGGLDNRVVPGTVGVHLAPGVRAGDVATVFFYVASQLHVRVENGDLYTAGDEWGWYFKTSANSASLISCHSSGTAFDWNATRHPNGKRGTFSAAQVAEIRKILAEVDNIVYWGGDAWGDGTPDEMHFEIGEGVSVTEVAAVAAKLSGLVPTPQPQPQPGPPQPQPSPYSDQVKKDQFDLTDTGFPCAQDGIWGPQSIAACKAFQFAARIAVDGICGPTTRTNLHKVPSWHSHGNVADDNGGYPDLMWQKNLKSHGWHIETDGVWGTHSKSILRQFQQDKGITVDGNRGPQSWTTLYCTVN